MPRSFFATEDGMTATPGAGGEDSPQKKSWRDMTTEDWEVHKAKMRAENGAPEVESIEAPETEPTVGNDGLVVG